MKLGKLKKVDLRGYWKHEAHDFTNWLSDPDNIGLLADEIGIEIQVTQTEASVGKFNVDILAEEENTGRKIIIENQLEKTDHTHLGQLITYAAGIEAEYVIWIVRDVREEHQQAVDWLNEHTDEGINFFIVIIELWQIGESPPAPKFTVISRPNEWRRSVRTGTNEGGLSDTKTRQLEFWQQFKEYASTNKAELKLRTPRPRHWYHVSIGTSGSFISLSVDSLEDEVRCELYIPDSKSLYKTLLENKTKIEKELGIPDHIEWQELPDKKASRIRVNHGFTFSDSSTWEEAFKWLVDVAATFRKVFSKDWGSSG